MFKFLCSSSLWLFLFSLLLSSCASNQPSPTANPNIDVTSLPKPQNTFTPTATPELKYTIIPSMTPYTPPPKVTITLTPTPIGYSDLPDGEYILFRNKNWLEAYSVQDGAHTKLLRLKDPSVYLSRDKKNLVNVPNQQWRQSPTIINLETWSEEKLDFLKGCYQFFLRDGDDSYLASCVFMEGIAEGVSELYSISLDGTRKLQKTDCYADIGECTNAEYSPDGRWISYYWGKPGNGWSEKVGFYLTRADCMNSEGRCDETAKGPYSIVGGYAWSPDSRYIASEDYGSGIQLFEVIDGTIPEKPAIEISEPFEAADITWSPDSNRLAYRRGYEIRVVDINIGNSDWIARFDHGIEIIGWVKIKDGKVTP